MTSPLVRATATLTALDSRVHLQFPPTLRSVVMATHTETETALELAGHAEPSAQPVVKKQKKLKPARKQVEAGQVEKKETPQTGKEYSAYLQYILAYMTLNMIFRHLVQQMGRW